MSDMCIYMIRNYYLFFFICHLKKNYKSVAFKIAILHYIFFLLFILPSLIQLY